MLISKNYGKNNWVFIAKTMLSHTGAEVEFSNSEDQGAIVRVVWPKSALTIDQKRQAA